MSAQEYFNFMSRDSGLSPARPESRIAVNAARVARVLMSPTRGVSVDISNISTRRVREVRDTRQRGIFVALVVSICIYQIHIFDREPFPS